MSADKNLVKLKYLIQSGGFFSRWLANFGKKALTNIAIPLARENLPGLVSNLTSNAKKQFERKISGKGAFRAGKGYFIYLKERYERYYKNYKITRIFMCIN